MLRSLFLVNVVLVLQLVFTGTLAVWIRTSSSVDAHEKVKASSLHDDGEHTGIDILAYNAPDATATISVPCQGCFSDQARADDALVFTIGLSPSQTIDHSRPSIIIGGTRFLLPEFNVSACYTYSDVLRTGRHSSYPEDLRLFDTPVLVSINATAFDALKLVGQGDSVELETRHHLDISITLPDLASSPTLRIVLVATAGPSPRILDVASTPREIMVMDAVLGPESWDLYDNDEDDVNDTGDTFSDDEKTPLLFLGAEPSIEDEIEHIRGLETTLQSIQTELARSKADLAHRKGDARNTASTHDLLVQCDGLLCKAQVLADQLYHKISTSTIRSSYSPPDGSTQQHMISTPHQQGNPRNFTKANTLSSPSPQAATLSLIQTQDGNTISPKHPLIIALSALASLLGLTALISYIHKRCMSLRTKVDRAADREERRTARIYRRAARKAAFRKRFHAVVHSLDRFRGTPKAQRPTTYDDKRTMILQDAYLETLADLEQCEKGEVMEAEIRELRHANDIVTALVQHHCAPQGMLAPRDPPPPLVPLPYTPECRSRAASCATLPSYKSDEPPEYTSRAESENGSDEIVSVADGFAIYAPSMSSEFAEVRSQVVESQTGTSSTGHTRFTPTSSVVEISPRTSVETEWTGVSKDY